jgi:hypothetical protein
MAKPFTSYISFGDSVSTGIYAEGQPYQSLLSQDLTPSAPAQNQIWPWFKAVNGATVIDAADSIYATQIPPGSRTLVTYIIGSTEGAAGLVNNSNNRQLWRRIQRPQIAWLAIPESRKIRAQDPRWQYTGTWLPSDDRYPGAPGLGRYATAVGSRAEVTVYGNRVVYGYTVADNTTGVVFQGVDQGQEYPPHYQNFFPSVPITGLGTARNYAPHIGWLTNLSLGYHTMWWEITTAGRVQLDWAAGLTCQNLPWVYSSGPPGYNGQPPDSQFTAGAPGWINSEAQRNAEGFWDDGLLSRWVDLAGWVDPTTGFNPGDLVHPNAEGNRQIYEAYRAALVRDGFI